MRCRKVWGGGRKRPGAQRSFLDLESERTHTNKMKENMSGVSSRKVRTSRN